MAVSKSRVDWSLLLLRVAVGGTALLHGFYVLLHAHGAATFGQAGALALAFLELACGALVILGLWTWLMAAILVVLAAWPLVYGWIHGAWILANPAGLARVLTTLACALGGGGKWAVGD